ncbi:MAG: 4-(cytidine 5'-diphospho)-2-C-methyl-D-erythritol kinase [Cyclobacteriaceae bacterium]|nr:4-(cytidine 5'-diphospho)-2-C-methyl-D-erythritol kinase [Cyclobacteriaceae bacterium]
MVSFPGCKINLGLQVVSRRPDGYHNINTCFFPLAWSDVLEILPAPTFSFSQTGLTIPGDTDDNLCVKAYQLLKKDFKLPPIQMHLHKVVPLGAGLGGGSADGAHTLMMLNKTFQLNISNDQLLHYASMLGSDCAFFIGSRPALGTGRGEVLTDLDISLKGYYLTVIVPAIHVATADAYRRVVPKEPAEALRTIVSSPVTQWKTRLLNDFEPSMFQQHSAIGKLKAALYDAGAIYAAMSGSGSAVYGIFTGSTSLETIRGSMPGWSGWI